MKRLEAIALLAECRPLVDKLASQGIDIDLTKQDRAALVGFTKVLADEWLFDTDNSQEAGLSSRDVEALTYLASKEQIAEGRRFYDKWERND